MLRVILIGAPGAGKGTQAKMLERTLHIPQVSTGDLLRSAVAGGAELGKLAEIYMNKGELVPDNLIIALMKETLSKQEYANGYILDGFPRTIPQALALENEGIAVDGVINIHVDGEEIVARLSSRRQCRKCGAIFNASRDNTQGNSCQKCGGELFVREDDNIKTIRERQRVYHEKTSPLLSFYEKRGLLKTIEGKGSPEEVFANILAAFGVAPGAGGKPRKVENKHA
ncbi:MAG: adenylate kinase [Deltaproteobacteria bacterium]|nr:adenylate kinase [Deltaproteobacteria bacterium]